MKYEFLEHPADLRIRSFGDTLEELFSNSAKGMFDAMIEGDIKIVGALNIELESEDLDSLLVRFLNELLYLFETEGAVFREFNLNILEGYTLKCTAWGEKYDPVKHGHGLGIKAATYQQIKIHHNEEYVSEITLDI